MNFVLMRHGHTIWNGPPMRHQGRQNSNLSESGLVQAQALFGKYDVDHLISSPAGRCLQTCQVVYGRAPECLDERLWELDMGWFSGLTRAQVQAKDAQHYQKWLETPDQIVPGNGESLQQVQDRVMSALKHYCQTYSDAKNLTFLVHGGVMKVIVCLAHGLSLAQYHRIQINNLCRLSFSLEDDGVISGNDCIPWKEISKNV